MKTYRINSRGEFDRVRVPSGSLVQTQGIVQDMVDGEQKRKSHASAEEDDEDGKYMKIAIKSQNHFAAMLDRLPTPKMVYLVPSFMLLANVIFIATAITQFFVFKSVYNELISSLGEIETLSQLGVDLFESTIWILQANLVKTFAFHCHYPVEERCRTRRRIRQT